MDVTWRKIWRDLLYNKVRTVLVVLSIAVGVFVLGVVFGAYSMIVDSLEKDRQAWIPIHVTFWGWFEQEAEYAVLREEGIADVERQSDTSLHWRLEGETDWHEGRVLARQDYEAQRMGLLNLVDGDWPERRALAVESMTAKHFNVPLGSVIIVQTGQRERRLRVGGIIRDPDAGIPPRFGGGADFFVAPETATWLTGVDYNRLDVRLESPGAVHAREMVDQVRARLGGMGVSVGGAWVRNLDEHWFKDSLDTMLLILTISGALSLAVSVFLIVNTMNAIVAQQVWQIGVMKVVGATRARVTRVYLTTGLIYGALALSFAVPSGAIGAYRLAAWALDLLNLAIGPFRVMPSAVLIQIGAGLAVPLLAALVPVMGGTRITAHQAISTYGLGGELGEGLLDRWIGRIGCLPRPMTVSLRNVFRRKARVALTLMALALGGALFMAVISVEASCSHTIEAMLNDSGADATVHFARSYRVEHLLAATERVPGVVKAEVWKRWGVRLKLADGSERDLLLVGVPPSSGILNPRVVGGRGLLPGDGNAILLNSAIAADEGIRVGDDVRFDINDEETTWTVVGLVRNADNRSFVPFDALSRESGSLNRGWQVAVMSERHDSEARRQLLGDLRTVYAAHHLEADDLSSASQIRERIRARFDVVLCILLIMSLLAAGVGGIGLMSTMSINVVERRREIGVMRATGATSAAVAAIFVAEGLVVGVLSWLLAVPISYPGAQLFSALVGKAMLRFPFEFTYSLSGVGLWLAVVIVVSVLASLWPALRATQVSVREALAYE